jgi:pyroglutamyl-peptidase
MTTLVTGFDPFGGLRSNPSQTAGSWLAAQREDILYLPVPTSYARSVEALQRAVQTHRPTALLLLGFAARAAGLRLERLARNATTTTAPDNDGKCQAGPILEGGPPWIETSVDYDRILRILASKGIPHTASDDAGGYVCNWLYWHALVGDRTLPTLFVHLAEPANTTRWRETHAGLMLIADAVATGSAVSTRRAASRSRRPEVAASLPVSPPTPPAGRMD